MSSPHNGGVSQSRVRETTERLRREAEASGYHLNPDPAFAEALVEGLLTNEGRYGYWACPCRLADGSIENDRDIICPCDYRDDDVLEWNACFCCLYVSQAIVDGTADLSSIPERRPPLDARTVGGPIPAAGGDALWRCSVCGYLCARAHAPETCPICRAKQDRFVPHTLAPPSGAGGRQASEVVFLLLRGPEEPCRLMHAFLWALDLLATDIAVSLVFEGMAPAWLPLLVEPMHPQHALYRKIMSQKLIAGVCRACAAKADAVDVSEREGIPVLDAASGHASLRPFVNRGATILTL